MGGIASPGVGRARLEESQRIGETGADDAGNSEGCDRSYELVAICPEARAVTLGKSVYEVAEQGLGWVGDSTWFMGKGIEFIGKVKEAWIPS